MANVDLFTASKLGAGLSVTVPTSGGGGPYVFDIAAQMGAAVASFYNSTPNAQAPKLFLPLLIVVIAFDGDIRIDQGSSDMQSASTSLSFILKGNVYWPITIEGPNDRWLRVISEEAGAVTAQFTLISQAAPGYGALP